MIRAVAFDFDGVIVESVDVKTRAFARLFEWAGPAVVADVVSYHLAHGGVSRIEKFRYFYEHLLHAPLSERRLAELAEEFSRLVFDAVVAAPFVPGAPQALADCRSRGFRTFIVSGTPQDELDEVVSRRGLAPRFDGVFGSPRRKGELLGEILRTTGLAGSELLFVGDAKTDYDGAQEAGTRFVARISESAPDWEALGVRVLGDLTRLPSLLDELDGSAG